MLKIQIHTSRLFHPRVGHTPRMKPFNADRRMIGNIFAMFAHLQPAIEIFYYEPDSNTMLPLTRENYIQIDATKGMEVKEYPAGEIPEDIGGGK